jgi:hypothetical protein
MTLCASSACVPVLMWPTDLPPKALFFGGVVEAVRPATRKSFASSQKIPPCSNSDVPKLVVLFYRSNVLEARPGLVSVVGLVACDCSQSWDFVQNFESESDSCIQLHYYTPGLLCYSSGTVRNLNCFVLFCLSPHPVLYSFFMVVF